MGSRVSFRIASLSCLIGLVACTSNETENSLEIGVVDELGFRTIESGDQLRYGPGVQGGYWLMPSLRAREISTQALWSVTLFGEDDAVAGGVESGIVSFIEEVDGWKQAPWVGVPLGNNAPELDGTRCRLEIDVWDNERTLAAEVEVLLELEHPLE